MQAMTHNDERKVSRCSYPGVPSGGLAPNALVVPTVDHEVDAIQLVKPGVSSTLESTESESSVSPASISMHNDVVEDSPDVATQSTSDEEILDEMSNSLTVEPPRSPRSSEIDSAEMERPLPNPPTSVNETPDSDSPVIGSEGVIDVEPRAEVTSPLFPNSLSASPSRDMEDSPSPKEDSTPSGEVYIKQESLDNSVPLPLGASYLGVIYHVLDVSKAHVCRLCFSIPHRSSNLAQPCRNGNSINMGRRSMLRCIKF
ncbi:hypothetical protein BDZ94DRAFT_234059 [Collybia nuda]|uniref:Uncharacterized protein n=1 Tax=Collybia nuda TaxID=64659 RepID=A0A9P5XXB4_9AGAR|nr:hypothetical protein BDZ94DRAFT_234059 [Collybia nuda]